MRRERVWEGLEPTLQSRKVCIREGGVNNARARSDFDAGLVRYYTFPLEEADIIATGNEVVRTPKRGYARLQENATSHSLILDFVSPYGDEQSWEAVAELAVRMKKVTEIWVPYDNTPQYIKGRLIEKGRMNIPDLTPSITYRVYTYGDKDIYAIDPFAKKIEIPIPEEVKL